MQSCDYFYPIYLNPRHAFFPTVNTRGSVVLDLSTSPRQAVALLYHLLWAPAPTHQAQSCRCCLYLARLGRGHVAVSTVPGPELPQAGAQGRQHLAGGQGQALVAGASSRGREAKAWRGMWWGADASGVQGLGVQPFTPHHCFPCHRGRGQICNDPLPQSLPQSLILDMENYTFIISVLVWNRIIGESS